jgi:hypothetical protein
LEISRYVQPLFRSIENAGESGVKWGAVYGIALALMLFLQITLLLFMLSIVKDAKKLNETNLESSKAAEESVK